MWPREATPAHLNQQMTNHDRELLVQYGQYLPENRRRRFHHIYMSRRKDITPAVLLALFLGGIGAHHFYLGNTLVGVLFLLFCWTFIPLIISIIELLLLPVTLKNHDRHVAENVLSEIELIG